MPTKAQRLREQVSTNKRSQTELKFPSDVDFDGTGNIIRFSINIPSGSRYLSNGQYNKAIDPATGETITPVNRRSGNRASIARRFSESYTRTTTHIDLFMPPEIQTSYTSDWNSQELGSIGAAVDAGMGLTNIDSWDDAKNALGVVANTLKDSGLRTLTSSIEAITPLAAESTRRLAQSSFANPYMEVLFNGVQNRTFSFTFKMIPRNEQEQRTISNIVNEFKFHRAPEIKYENQNNTMLFPSQFDIKFINRGGENDWLFKISTCALTNFTVNYSPEGQYASREDGSPFATEITLEFTELEILTKDRIREGF